LPVPDPRHAERLFYHSRREAAIVLVVWFLALVWSVGYSYLFGYQHPPDSWVVQRGWVGPQQDFGHFLGIPHWVWFGIILPWLLCTVFTFLLAAYGIADDELGSASDQPHDTHVTTRRVEEANHGH
jgi:hypothetical protein